MTLTKKVFGFGLGAMFLRTVAIAASETKGPRRKMESAKDGTRR